MSLMSLRFISVLVLFLPRTSAGQFSCIRREEHEFVTLYGIEGYEGSTTHPNTRQVTTCLHWARGLVKQVILPSLVRSALKSIWSYAPGLHRVCAGSAPGRRARTMATRTSSWSASMCTTMRPPVVATYPRDSHGPRPGNRGQCSCGTGQTTLCSDTATPRVPSSSILPCLSFGWRRMASIPSKYDLVSSVSSIRTSPLRRRASFT